VFFIARTQTRRCGSGARGWRCSWGTWLWRVSPQRKVKSALLDRSGSLLCSLVPMIWGSCLFSDAVSRALIHFPFGPTALFWTLMAVARWLSCSAGLQADPASWPCADLLLDVLGAPVCCVFAVSRWIRILVLCLLLLSCHPSAAVDAPRSRLSMLDRCAAAGSFRCLTLLMCCARSCGRGRRRGGRLRASRSRGLSPRFGLAGLLARSCLAVFVKLLALACLLSRLLLGSCLSLHADCRSSIRCIPRRGCF
jgi:hypothetical protein